MRGASGGGVADHCWPRGERADRQDDVGARAGRERNRGGAALPRSARRLCGRPRRCQQRHRASLCHGGGAYADAHPRGSGPARARGARSGRRAGPADDTDDCRMNALRNICAVVPVKETRDAKQRLAGVLTPRQRQALALALLAALLAGLTAVPKLSGILVVTIDPAAAAIAARHGSRIVADGARDGHTGAVAAATRRLAAEGRGLLEVPGDIPLVEADDVSELIAA